MAGFASSSLIELFKSDAPLLPRDIVSAVEAESSLATEVDPETGNTALHYACCMAAPLPVVEALLGANKAAARAEDADGNIPLMGAVANGCDVGSRGDGLPDRYEPAHLRDAVTLVLAGQTAWAQGHILLGEGARLVTDADLEVVDDADLASPGLLATARDATPGRQEDARNGWYTNPACGDRCAAQPILKSGEDGSVAVAAADAVVEPTLFVRGEASVAAVFGVGHHVHSRLGGTETIEAAEASLAPHADIAGERALLRSTRWPTQLL